MELCRSTQRRRCEQQRDLQESMYSHNSATILPGEVLEQVLSHVPFHERVRAAAVCRAWRQHMAQCGLPIWQAVSIGNERKWDYPARDRMQLFLSLQRWLLRCGRGLVQLHCCTSFYRKDTDEDGLLATLLSTLAAAAPMLQALRLDACAGRTLTDSSMIGIASMGNRLRQLALIGLHRVSDGCLVTALAQLPKLQGLAVMFVDRMHAERMASVTDWDDNPSYMYKPPDMMRLLANIAASCPALETLALGHVPSHRHRVCYSVLKETPLPAAISRLSALSCLLLHDTGWDHAPDGLARLPQLRRLSLRGEYGFLGDAREPGYPHHLSTLTGLEALQATLPIWPGRLPPALTHLVLSPLCGWYYDSPDRERCVSFLRGHLPPLCGLRHLAFHGLTESGNSILQAVCIAAAALPQLISLHVVNCDLKVVPAEMCELGQLQLLNLSSNPLQDDGYSRLARAQLHKLTSCRQLDLRCGHQQSSYWQLSIPLKPDVLGAIASMPALEQLALPSTKKYRPSAQEVAQLVERRGAGRPPIRVVTDMPESDSWAAVDVEVPRREISKMLGGQMDCSVVPGIPINW